MKLKQRGHIDVTKQGSDELEYRFKFFEDVTPQGNTRPKNKRVFFWAYYDDEGELQGQSEKRFKKLEHAIDDLRKHIAR